MQDFEKLGVFYLGREYDLAHQKPRADLLLYDSADLTTHAVCVGMTGSGKTGLCIALLEEAAIDGVPAIAIDPKGDLGNLLLTFPQLRGEDFEPWVDEGEAKRKSISTAELAAQTAERWRKGLAEWGEDGARIERLRAAADMAIYTPGSSAGLPLTVLKSFTAPSKDELDDGETMRERIGATVAGLLALVGVDADPVRSRESILLAQLLEARWRAGQDLDLADLIRGIQSPPFDRVGFVDLETFFPTKERVELAMKLNNLLASPGFAGWMQGEPLDVAKLLHTPEGKPRISILSIAHLSDAERMFFVTILLGEVLAWVRRQTGTSSLRAILYMDEIAGYFPPTANPPSKAPMLTLLKQARAFGLGVVLATQNPVDLDYKGLSNAGTWFLGRLQTERDKARVLEGLEGASAAAGAQFDRAAMEATLAGLGARVFLMNNVHEDHPVVFQSRWCLSYLRGPLARQQIQTLMATRKSNETVQEFSVRHQTVQVSGQPVRATAQQPIVPPDVRQMYMCQTARSMVAVREPDAPPKVYQPVLFGVVKMHFVDSKANLDQWQNGVGFITPVFADANDNPLIVDEAGNLVGRRPPDAREPGDDVWQNANRLSCNDMEVTEKPGQGLLFAPLPAQLLRSQNYAKWQKSLAAWAYGTQTLTLWTAPALGEISRPDESQADFRVRAAHLAREARDAATSKLRQKYAAKINTLENQIRRAEERVSREKSQFQSSVVQSAISIGSSVLRVLTGRKWASGTNVTSAAAAARAASRSAGQHEDISRANADLEALQDKRANLEAEVTAEIDRLAVRDEQMQFVEYPVRPRKGDLAVEWVALAWVA